RFSRDWSSNVCSSDLCPTEPFADHDGEDPHGRSANGSVGHGPAGPRDGPVRRPGAGAGEHAGRLWTRELLTAVVVNTLTMLVFYLLMTTMALYAAQRFAASDSLAGLASSMFIVGA